MRPSAGKVHHKRASLPTPTMLIPAFDLLWKGIDLPLWNPQRLILLPVLIIVDNVPDALLFVQLRVLVTVLANSVQERETAGP